jgi:hypothetical protein
MSLAGELIENGTRGARLPLTGTVFRQSAPSTTTAKEALVLISTD